MIQQAPALTRLAKFIWRSATVVLCAALGGLGINGAYGASFTTFVVPGAATSPTSINNGVTTGIYFGHYKGHRGRGWYGFVRTKNGKIARFEAAPDCGANPTSINDVGSITGYCFFNGVDSGFLRLANGGITLFKVDSSTTEPVSINDKGEIVGHYGEPGSGNEHGFVRSLAGNIKTIDVAGASGTSAQDINDKDTIVGGYWDSSGELHGFLRADQSGITTFDPVGSINTNALSINGGGAITGYFEDSSGAYHGFVRAVDGTITPFDVTGETGGTFPTGIDDKGSITGNYYVVANASHGFLRSANGTITKFDPPGSTDTYPEGINGGVIVGNYSGGYGFLRFP